MCCGWQVNPSGALPLSFPASDEQTWLRGAASYPGVRQPGGPWNPLYQGQTHVLNHGDQVSLDQREPEGSIFAFANEGGMQGGYGQQQQQGGGYGYGQQGGYGYGQGGY